MNQVRQSYHQQEHRRSKIWELKKIPQTPNLNNSPPKHTASNNESTDKDRHIKAMEELRVMVKELEDDGWLFEDS